MKRKLLTTKDATPASKQITKPCSDCPWARAALNGWLGGNTAEEWISFAHGEAFIECHVHPNIQCAGAAIYRANVCKSPRDPKILQLESDTKLVFATPQQFLTHHEATTERKLRDKLAARRAAQEQVKDCSRCGGSGDDPDGGRCDCCGGTGCENPPRPVRKGQER